MILWFVATAWLAVWLVFRDPHFDYRILAIGALLPDIVDAPFGGARVMHTMIGNVALLIVVMLATIGRRARRRMLLALPIGCFLHLVFDGAFANTTVLWWPFTGGSFDDAPLPSVERGAISIVLEVVGLAVLFWFWRRFQLADPDRRRTLVRTGHLVE
jgi:nitrogen fixation-related uncharacterized protein